MKNFEAKTPSAKALGVDEAAMWRAELNDTLLQLQDRLNYSRRIDNAVADAKVRFTEAKQQRPLTFIAGVAGAAVLAGVIMFAVVKRASAR